MPIGAITTQDRGPLQALASANVWGVKPSAAWGSVPGGGGVQGNGFGAFPTGNIPYGANGFGSGYAGRLMTLAKILDDPRANGPAQGPAPDQAMRQPGLPGGGMQRGAPLPPVGPGGMRLDPTGMQHQLPPGVLDVLMRRTGYTGRPNIGGMPGINPGSGYGGDVGRNPGGGSVYGFGGGDTWLRDVMQRHAV